MCLGVSATGPPGHLRSLTGLRFVAAALVVLFHCSVLIEPLRPTAAVFGLGYVGVTFFFVLSGFVLSWTARPDDRPSRFYWRRFARVWPLTAIVTLAAVPVVAGEGVAQSAGKFVASFFLVQAWIPQGDWRYAYTGVTWSLSCELFFYALFPALIVLARRVSVRVAAAVLVGLIVAGTVLVLTISPTLAPLLGVEDVAFHTYVLYALPAFRLLEFALGIVLALALSSGWRPPLSLPAAVGLCVVTYACLAAVASLAFYEGALGIPFGLTDMLLLVPVALLIAAAATRDMDEPDTRSWLASKVLVRLGQWSFALYLVHHLALRATGLLLPGRTVWDGVVHAGVTVVLSLLLAAIAYEFFERPVERRLRLLMPGRSSALPLGAER